MSDPRTSTRASRREFVRLSLLAATAVVEVGRSHAAPAVGLPAPRAIPRRFTGGRFPPAATLARGRALGANDRIFLGHVGVGDMGAKHVEQFHRLAEARNTRSIALADVYAPHLERGRALLAGGAAPGAVQAVVDYRRLLDNRDVDAVVIATPEHWHGQIAVHALAAGKHVYVEKPVSRYLDEAFQLYDTWKKSGKIVQVGAQACSDPRYHAARDVIASGKLGPLVGAQTSYTKINVRHGVWRRDIDPAAGPHNLDWPSWLGSAPRRPWNDDARTRFFWYRLYRDYSAGVISDFMPHRIAPLLLALGGRDWPIKVQCLGTRHVATDQEISDTVHVAAEMERGWTLSFLGSIVNEQGVQELVRGNRATLYLAGREPEVKAERPFAEEIEGGVVPVASHGEDRPRHQQNWLDAIRLGTPLACDMELGVRMQALISLAEISEVTGKTVHFDPTKRAWTFA